MKNFFKKLSFVLASAMVITSLYAPAATSAAAKDGILLKGKSVKTKGIFVGGDKLNFDYKIGKHNNKGANGKWSVSDSSVIKVNKHGVVTAVGTGEATLMLKVKKNTKKGIKKDMTFKVTINAMARASKLEIPASDKAISIKVGEKKDIMPVLTNKVDGVDSTYNLFAKSSDDSVATVMVDGKKVTVEAKMASATPATITVFAAQKNDMKQAWDNKYKVHDSFEVTVKGDFSAEQTGAKTVKVMGTDLTDKAADYVIKNEKGVSLAVKEAKLDESKTFVVLTVDTYQIPEGKYTLTFNKKEANFTAEKAKVAKIVFTQEDKAIGMYDKNNSFVEKAAVVFQVFDQFGNDITETNIPRLNIFGSHNAATEGKGRIVFKTTQAQSFQINLSKVSANVVDLNSGVSAGGMFTVSDIARVYEAKYAGIFNKVSRKFVKTIAEDSNIENNYLLFEIKDQFGNVLDDPKLTDQLFVNVLSQTVKVKVEADKEYIVEHEGKKYVAYQLKSTVAKDQTISYGKVDVQAMITTNGKVLKETFDVTYKVQVDTITLREGATGVNVGEENTLEYTAYDLDGKLVTSYEVLKNSLVDMKTTAPKLALYEDKATGKGIFKFDARTGFENLNDDAMTVPTTINLKTVTGKFSVNTINVRAMRRPVSFKGIDESVAKGVTKGSTFKLSYSKLIFKDQFGNDMTAKDIAELYSTDSDYGLNVTITDASTALFDSAASNVKINNQTTLSDYNLALTKTNLENDFLEMPALTTVTASGYATITIYFNKKHTGNEYGHTTNHPALTKLVTQVYAVNINDMKYFEVKKLDKVAAFDLYDTPTTYGLYEEDNKYFVAPTVYGYYEGVKIALAEGKDFNLSGAVNATGETGHAESKFIKIPSRHTISGTDADAYFQIGIANEKRTVLTEKYTFSKELPKIVKIENNGKEVEVRTATDGTLTWEGGSGDDGIRKAIDIKDQYGNVVKVAPIVYLEEVRDSAGAKISNLPGSKFKLTNDGSAGFSLETFESGTGVTAGKYALDVKVVVPNTNLVLRTTITLVKK